jgi:hypothetical protein
MGSRGQIGPYKKVARKQGHPNHDFAIPAFAPDCHFRQKNFYRFLSEAVINDIFKSAFGMQHIPEGQQFFVYHLL